MLPIMERYNRLIKNELPVALKLANDVKETFKSEGKVKKSKVCELILRAKEVKFVVMHDDVKMAIELLKMYSSGKVTKEHVYEAFAEETSHLQYLLDIIVLGIEAFDKYKD